MALNINKLKRGSVITNSTSFGVINFIGFGNVLVNWEDVNPPPHPPVCYPIDVFTLAFGIGYRLATEEELFSLPGKMRLVD